RTANAKRLGSNPRLGLEQLSPHAHLISMRLHIDLRELANLDTVSSPKVPIRDRKQPPNQKIPCRLIITISSNEHRIIRAQQVPLRGREELRVNLGTRHRPHSTISNRHDGTTNPRRTKRPTNPRPINNRLNRNTTVRIHRLTNLPRAILLAP